MNDANKYRCSSSLGSYGDMPGMAFCLSYLERIDGKQEAGFL